MTSPSRGGSRRKRPVLLPVIAVLLATGLGTTAVLGGLDTIPDPPPQRLGPRAVLDQGQFRTEFVESVYTVVPPETEIGDERHRLDLVFKVTNLGDETAPVGVTPGPGRLGGGSFASSILRLDPAVGDQSGIGIVVSRDVESRQLHPGVTSTVIIRYDLRQPLRDPDTVTVDMGTFEYREGIMLTPGWWVVTESSGERVVPKVVAKVTLPVRREVA